MGMREEKRFQKVSISSPEWAPEGDEAKARSWDGQLDALSLNRYSFLEFQGRGERKVGMMRGKCHMVLELG